MPRAEVYVYHRLVSRGERVAVDTLDLARYDDNIRVHLQAINLRRPESITLRYFQYLAALYTELFLDRFFNRRAELVRSLNEFAVERNATRLPDEPQDAVFVERDLKKLAFWMATGSGKTLIMHLNYRQFLQYNNQPLDNILLVTPNEGLSEQHLQELEISGIPARRFDLNDGGFGFSGENAVRVIEITKLVEEKRGGGVSVPVEAFEGNNLILVDEGHKGSGGEVWRKYRDALGETGFTFEYSATFGQALTATRNDDLTEEYGKSIAFDYSYRYFYGDGYGKDFRVLNLKQESTEDKTDVLLLGNLLSFYEQIRLSSDRRDALRPYNLERPLWVFVGSTVNAVYSETKQRRSDVLTVARFFHRYLQNKRKWATRGIKKLLDGKSDLVDVQGNDLFAGRFPYLHELGIAPEYAYEDILAVVLHAQAPGGLRLCDIRGSDGEIGLKVAGAERYFGVIYVGDTSAFKKLIEEEEKEIALETDAVTGSLFEGIGRADTCIEVLIGAKKFMEGWNSWRVATMGLLNIGRQEGSQIIQLFGRGVRLRGKAMSLKRSSSLHGHHPEHIGLLETLNIFAVRANYMGQFREYLEREGVETEEPIQLPLFIQPNREFLRQGLLVPRIPDDSSFAAEASLFLQPDPAVHAHVDMSLKVEAIQSSRRGVVVDAGHTGKGQHFPAESLALVDWERAYLDLLEFKSRKGMTNVVIAPNAPKSIIGYEGEKGERLYRLLADDTVVRPNEFAGASVLHDAIMNVLRKYTEDFYRIKREKWESGRMVYRELGDEDPNLAFNREQVKERRAGYVIKVKRSERALADAVTKLMKDGERLFKEENSNLPRIHFDRHLYLPLLLERSDEVMSTLPPMLNSSEATFVRDLKDYWKQEHARALKTKNLYLLRNLSRGSGIGFFEESGFYPDFILWLVDEEKGQRIIFVEPHGMLHAKAYEHDDKARLHERLPVLAGAITSRTKPGVRVALDSFIISATSFEDLFKRYDDGSWDRAKFAARHILFPERNERYDYLKQIFVPHQ